MEIIDVPLAQLMEAQWNSNFMDDAMRQKLGKSLGKYGLVQNLAVRPLAGGIYEVLSGNQRLQVLRELGYAHAPCLVVDLSDAQARLLSQALNRITGEDDLGLRAELLREVIKAVPQEAVLSLLPETSQSLQALTSLGQEDIASHLHSWQQAQGARLKHLTFQLTQAQLEVIEAALALVLPQARETQGDNPNPRGNALFLLCKSYLELTRREA